MRRLSYLSTGLATVLAGYLSCSSDSDPKGKGDSKGGPNQGVEVDEDNASEGGADKPDNADPSGGNGSVEIPGNTPKKPDQPDQDGKFLYSYIWVANSTQGTISKINTRTLKEEGRYQTRPDREGDPSRTSVGISGDVVVANRNGGVTKVIADHENCIDKNKDGKIQTSKGANDILPWGEDECVAWHTPMQFGSQRVIAWTYEKKGSGPEGGADIITERVWVSGINQGENDIHIHLLDGESGEILDKTATPSLSPSGAFPYGAYGGAVDGKNNLWFAGVGPGKLYRVSYEDLSVKHWDKPSDSYGVTVDPKGRPWVCGTKTSRFDPKTETWKTATYPQGLQSIDGGCMVDGKGRLWFDLRKGLLQSTLSAIDIESLEVVESIDMPEHPHGVSIDFDGNVWGIGRYSTKAYRVDPKSKKIDTIDGLVQAYTYSDMTGFALGAVQENPPI